MGAIKTRGFNSALDSLRVLREGWGTDSRWIVGVGAEYGAYVEFGTSRMRAQPYLFPAARKVMRTEFAAIGRRASTLPQVVELTAHAIEAEAKRRAPVDTGNLQNSIEAVPASAVR